MKKLLILGMLLVIGMEIYTAMRPTEILVEAHVVRRGDTMYGICDRYYITQNNTECFNEFWHRIMKENNKTALDVGDVVWISNKVYK